MGILFHHKKEIEKSLEENIDKNELVYFEFSESELKSLEWEHNKEFKHNGNMYDIVHREHNGNKHLLWCYKDDFERELKKKINHFLAFGFDDDIQKNNNQKKLSHFFHGLFFQSAKLKLDCFAFITITRYPGTFCLINVDLSPSYPPPKTGCML